MLSKQEPGEQAENHKAQINAFFDVLEERFLDINPYCRSRALQVYMRICDLETKFPRRRQTATELAARSLEDKSSNVRRNAMKLLEKLISTHPFSVLHGGLLSQKEWQDRLDATQTELDALKAPQGNPSRGEEEGNGEKVDEELMDDATEVGDNEEQSNQAQQPMSDEQKQAALQKAAEEAATSEAISKLQLTQRYYAEALRFIEVLHDASPIICQLLLSKNKSEVIEAMDFFMIADAYRVETARQGIRKMLHLIWTKGNSDEGKGVQSHLTDCYKSIFFDAPDTFNQNDAANYVARNMISLTYGASVAELTSLEQLLSSMMKGELISDIVVAKLWQIYSVQRREISKTQRRGAILVLSMLAVAKPDIVVQEMESLLRIGLGSYGKADLILAKYSCIALSRMKPNANKAKDAPPFSRLPNDHAVLLKLAAMVEMPSNSKDWYGVAEQAIGAVYNLSKHPDVLCTEVIRRRTKEVFAPPQAQTQESSQRDEEEDASQHDGSSTPTPAPPPKTNNKPQQPSSTALSQLLFTVGHVSIKQIVHLDLCELDFKKRKAEREKEASSAKPLPMPEPTRTAFPRKINSKTSPQAPAEGANELDLIGGTSEDDLTEAIHHIREREILYGPSSLLSTFGPLASELCANNTAYPDPNLQAVATICMAKLMCVSSEYCEANLPLLITILERSSDPITRSNVVIALGDMAVCFNNLIDENTDFLYRRLGDPSISVKRTCLMTLTFLILAGQLKTKGQLGLMAKTLEDTDTRITDLSRMFFSELATKDNAIYNQFVDMFSVLSSDEDLGEEGFKRITKFLAGFVERERHAKNLSNKLAARLGRCQSAREWGDVAFALGCLRHGDDEIGKVLAEGFKGRVGVESGARGDAANASEVKAAA